MATAYFSTADEAVMQGGKRQKERLKGVSIFLLIPQSTRLPEGESSEFTKGIRQQEKKSH